MSLINEALKKAQKMRQADAPSPSPEPAASEPTPPPPPPASVPAAPSPSEVRPPARIAKRRQPLSANRILATVAAGVVGFVILAGAAVVLLLPDQEPPELVARPSSPAPTASDPLTPAPVISPAPIKPNPAPAPTPVAAINAPTPEPSPVSVNLSPVPPPSVATTTAPANPPPVNPAPVASPAPARPVPTAGPAALDPRVVAYIEQLRVSGVRPSPTDPRVLMSDRVFRLGDVVDRSLGLRLTKVEERKLTFTDAAGVTYQKFF